MVPKSRCDLCGKRIGPARYELGLCSACESIVNMVDAFAIMFAITELLTNPNAMREIEEMSQGMANAVRLLREDNSGG